MLALNYTCFKEFGKSTQILDELAKRYPNDCIIPIIRAFLVAQEICYQFASNLVDKKFTIHKFIQEDPKKQKEIHKCDALFL